MKKTILLFILCFCSAFAFSQVSNDSSAYQAERKKINTMLAKRSQKFGKYAESLNKHSGIFGMQTKKDIRNSNDILMDIAKTDDSIFKELKVLLEYQIYQQSKVQNHSKETEVSNLGYMTTINKLRGQIELLKGEQIQKQQQYEKIKKVLIILAILLFLSTLLLLRPKSKRKR